MRDQPCGHSRSASSGLTPLRIALIRAFCCSSAVDSAPLVIQNII